MKTLKLPELPFGANGLGTKMSAETIEFHYGKHHKAYIDNTNKMWPEATDASLKNAETLEALLTAFGKKGEWSPAEKKLFNNAAQVWNHTFFWYCLTASSSSLADGPLLKQINKDFGSLDALKTKFSESAVGNFGSGWTWLVKKANGSLAIVNTSNAETPATTGDVPVLTCDVWEHAYYVDYRNQRAGFVDAVWSMFNWKYAEENFKGTSAPNVTKYMV
jgi:Fe-Mn family superoxide dismutase